MLEKFSGVTHQWPPWIRVVVSFGHQGGQDLPSLRFYPVTKLEAEGLGHKGFSSWKSMLKKMSGAGGAVGET